MNQHFHIKTDAKNVCSPSVGVVICARRAPCVCVLTCLDVALTVSSTNGSANVDDTRMKVAKLFGTLIAYIKCEITSHQTRQQQSGAHSDPSSLARFLIQLHIDQILVEVPIMRCVPAEKCNQLYATELLWKRVRKGPTKVKLCHHLMLILGNRVLGLSLQFESPIYQITDADRVKPLLLSTFKYSQSRNGNQSHGAYVLGSAIAHSGLLIDRRVDIGPIERLATRYQTGCKTNSIVRPFINNKGVH